MHRTLYFGDNLDAMRHLPSERVELTYPDLPDRAANVSLESNQANDVRARQVDGWPVRRAATLSGAAAGSRLGER